MTRHRAWRFGLVVAACVVAQAAARADDAWGRSLKRRGVDPALVVNPIEITPQVREAADELSGNGGNVVDQLKRMQSALFDPGRFTFDYEAGLTYTAAEALAARRGNCVAFTNLFIAMARSRGIRVKAGYMTPRVAGEKRGDLVYVNTHVVAVYQLHDRFVVFDFYRTREDEVPRIRLLDDFELAALYVNNRAVEALSRGEFVEAEAQLEAVIRLAPQFVGAHGNLGVLKRRRGDVSGALDAYRAALALEPHNPTILANLSSLYVGMGLYREAQAALRLADMSSATTYTILARGDLEAADGNPDGALSFYRRAARLDATIPDPYVAIARLEKGRGRLAEAQRAAGRALKLAPDNPEAQALSRELAGESGASP
jgi:tetratricopeptide (TPR) repeat protein